MAVGVDRGELKVWDPPRSSSRGAGGPKGPAVEQPLLRGCAVGGVGLRFPAAFCAVAACDCSVQPAGGRQVYPPFKR